MPYDIGMNKLEIVEKYYHPNGKAVPFVVAIVDDPTEGDTKLVIMFDEEDFTAVLSLDTLIESEDITPEGNSYKGDKYEKALRPHLWNTEIDYDYEEDPEDYEL